MSLAKLATWMLESSRRPLAVRAATAPWADLCRTRRRRFSVQPKALEAFTLAIDAPGAGKVSAEFQMVGMDMGFNRYDLRAGQADEFTANITLPVCVSGGHGWVLYLEIDGTRYAVPFSTR